MRETRQKIKRLAKTAMVGKFGKLIILLGLQYVTSALLVFVFGLLGAELSPEALFEAFGLKINYVSVAASLVAAVLASPLQLGIAEYILGLVRKREVHAAEVFNWYGDGTKLLKALPYGIWCIIAAIVKFALFDLPLSYVQAQLDIVIEDLLRQAEESVVMLVPNYGLMDWRGVGIALAVMLAMALLSALFACVIYIYLDTGRLFYAVFSSPRLMFKYVWAYFMFVLSFSGFYIGTVFTFGLLGIYLLPYFGVSNVVFTEYVRAKAKFDGDGEIWV